ncbi:hypothetical protein GCM10009834_48760 [Streptomonospora arabica]|uniref:Uncharacterized protein n=1 Tax=Streptomonospora halophila TaxID=427369 RepID=A0ABP9GFZ0_9ACTN
MPPSVRTTSASQWFGYDCTVLSLFESPERVADLTPPVPLRIRDPVTIEFSGSGSDITQLCHFVTRRLPLTC